MDDEIFHERTVKRRRYLSKTSEAPFEISSAACATRGESRVRGGNVIIHVELIPDQLK